MSSNVGSQQADVITNDDIISSKGTITCNFSNPKRKEFSPFEIANSSAILAYFHVKKLQFWPILVLAWNIGTHFDWKTTILTNFGPTLRIFGNC